jgi:NAD-dependent deacetylase
MSELSEKSLEGIRCAADILRASQRAVVLTGAGISTNSGIPDFRSPGTGIWEHNDPFEVASLTAFRYNPENFYKWLFPVVRGLFNAQPNPAHQSLARLEEAGRVQCIITQNIDRLHQRAGTQTLVEVHGSLDTLSCVCCFHQVESSAYLQAYLEREETPRCPECNCVLKPDIILFGEQLPHRAWLKAVEASKSCDLMIVAGSSLEVMPVAGLPMRAVENGARLIVINRTQTYIDERADVVFWEDVTQIIPRIAAEVLGD